ncbi:glycosyltransferase family protein [Leptolyngbya sp. AN03gr2]|uniref:glycosyltransferase n=1 Tax=unclassified Leptolyngbya TaxID=2650499 RepID=UPI003D31FC5B
MFKPKELSIRPFPAALPEYKLEEPEAQIIVACPQPPQEAIEAGRAIAVPWGEFDIDLILEKLPADFQPDFAGFSARTLHFKPRGLEKLPCPAVMKLGDTFHWGDGSLSGIIEYCQELQCDYHWVYQGVQHLHFFVEAGLKNVFWVPGTYVIQPHRTRSHSEKIYDVVFRGSQSSHHVQRTRLLQFLQQSGVEVDIAQKPYIDCLEDYTKAHIVLNFSLNGDTNRRVYEVLMAGGFLLTDRLSVQSGLFSLFEEGVHLECYNNEAELLEKIEYYLQHPDQAAQIAAAGHQKLWDCYLQPTMKQQLYRCILANEIEPPFNLAHDRRASVSIDSTPEALKTRIEVYELIQELHRLNPRIKLLYWRGTNHRLISDLADLQRLDLTCVQTEAETNTIEQWCSQVGVSDQVNVRSLPVELPSRSMQIVMVDLPTTMTAAEKLLQEVEPLISNGGLLLWVGTNPQLKKWLDRRLRTQQLSPVRLGVMTPDRIYEEMGKGVCLVYQRVQTDAPVLTFESLTFSTQLRQQLDSIQLVRRMKRIVDRSLLQKA